MSDFCYIEDLIDPNQCVGNSLSTINYNFSALDVNMCAISSQLSLQPVLEIIKNAPDVCFTQTRIIGSDVVHLFGGTGPSVPSISGDPSAWSSCGRKLPNILATLSGTTLNFPAIPTTHQNATSQRLLILDSNNNVQASSSVADFMPAASTVTYKNKSNTPIIVNPTTIKGSGGIDVTSPAGGIVQLYTNVPTVCALGAFTNVFPYPVNNSYPARLPTKFPKWTYAPMVFTNPFATQGVLHVMVPRIHIEHFQINESGSSYKFYWSPDGGQTWTYMTEYLASVNTPGAGTGGDIQNTALYSFVDLGMYYLVCPNTNAGGSVNVTFRIDRTEILGDGSIDSRIPVISKWTIAQVVGTWYPA